MRVKIVRTLCLSVAALLLQTGCGYAIYVRGVQEPEAGLIETSLPMHIQVRGTEKVQSSDELAVKIEKVLREKGYTIVPESQAEAYLFFEYEMKDLVQRQYLKPTSGASSGIKTTQSEGPFIHTLSVSVVNAASYMEQDKASADIIWAGGAVIDTTSLRSPKAVDMLVIALFDQFPNDTEQTLKTTMSLNDHRAESLRKDPEE